MRQLIYIGLLFLLIFTVVSCGCGERGGFPITNQTKPKTTTITTIPTPAFGNLVLSSKPVGANVYIEGQFRGNTPLNLTDIKVGKLNVSLQLEQYSKTNFTVDVKGGQTITVTKSLSETKPKIELSLSDPTRQEIPPCIYTFIGSLNNTGNEILKNAIITVEMKPKISDYDTVTKSIEIGDVSPGIPRPFGLQVTVLCQGNYQATIKWEGIELNDPEMDSDNRKMSGSKSF